MTYAVLFHSAFRKDTFAMTESTLTRSFTQTLIDLIRLYIPNFHSKDSKEACEFYVSCLLHKLHSHLKILET